MKKDQPWQWGEAQAAAFVKLKEALCGTTILRLPDHYKPFILTTDWSQKGMGAILSQVGTDGVEHPICYASRSCNPAEQNYSSFDGECLAVVWATSHFRSYLFGNSFTLVTDHEPLKWIMTTEKLTGKLARWSLLLQEYDFTVEHRKGIDNTNADCLSRYPLPSDADAPLMDWSKGEIMAPAAFLARMVDTDPTPPEEEKDIWQDIPVLIFLQTHKYAQGLSVKARDRIYRRGKSYRWMADGVYKILPSGDMVVVPRMADRESITLEAHSKMGHYGVQRVLDRLQQNYWWRGMGDTVISTVRSCH